VLKLKHLINLFILLCSFACFYVAALPQCNVVFPGAAATFNNAKVILNNKVKLNDNNNGWVYTKTVDIKYYDKWGKRPKCNNQYCYANGTEASQVPAITSNDTVTTLQKPPRSIFITQDALQHHTTTGSVTSDKLPSVGG
jgi:hypothetical protein